MRNRVLFIVLTVGVALLVSGSGVTAVGGGAAERPLYGVLYGAPPYKDPLELREFDPRTLTPLGKRVVRIPRLMRAAGRSPDGRFAAFFEPQPARLRVVDLETMRARADVPLGSGKRWRIREAAWLTADRLVFIVQRLRGSYEQIVDTRQIVVVDPLAGRVVARRPFANAMALQGTAQGGDKLVFLLGRGDRRGGRQLLAVVGTDGRVRTTPIELMATSPNQAALVVGPTGERAFVVAVGTSVFDVDLASLAVTRRTVTGAGKLFASAPTWFASRGALWIDEKTLAVFGGEHVVSAGVETSRPAGLALVDTDSWQARLIDAEASGASLSGETLLAHGVRIEPGRVRGRSGQRAVGIGLRAYDTTGALRWRRFGGQPLYAHAVRDVAVVQRVGLDRPGGGWFPVDLTSGRQSGPMRAAEENVGLLPEPVAGRQARSLDSSAQGDPALEVEGDGEAFTGEVRADVSRVTAVLVDGSERDVPLEEGQVAYSAASPEESARVLHAYVGESIVSTVALPVRCGGIAGPCAGTRVPSSRQQGDPFSRVSNRGTRVQAKARKRAEREHVPRVVFLLRQAEGRAVYRIGGLRPGYTSCYGSGSASEIGRLGSIGCGRSGDFPSRQVPLNDMSVYQSSLDPRTGRMEAPRLSRLEGVAADGVAEIGLTDAKGDVITRVPVVDNVYILASPPKEATGGRVAYSRNGEAVYRTDPQGILPRPPLVRPTSPRQLAGFRIQVTLPVGWSGEIESSQAGPARALLLAGNKLPARDRRSVTFALAERDPRSQPAFRRITAAPKLAASDVRRRGRYGRVRQNFTLNGRQFTLEVGFGASGPTPATLAQVNRMLATLSVGAIAVPAATPAGPPLQRGQADGLAVEVYRSGVVRLRFTSRSSRAYRLVRGRDVSISCLTFDSESPWEPNGWGTSKPFAETLQVTISEGTRPAQPYATLDPATEPSPPFDGCQLGGSYGRRWNDPRGQRAPAEVAFTAPGRRFFDERAVARDLALFVRSPVLAAIRRTHKRGGQAPAAAAITGRLPRRVVPVSTRLAAPTGGRIGIWSNGTDTLVVSERSTSGERLFVEIRGGRIHRHNLDGLAFVF